MCVQMLQTSFLPMSVQHWCKCFSKNMSLTFCHLNPLDDKTIHLHRREHKITCCGLSFNMPLKITTVLWGFTCFELAIRQRLFSFECMSSRSVRNAALGNAVIYISFAFSQGLQLCPLTLTKSSSRFIEVTLRLYLTGQPSCWCLPCGCSAVCCCCCAWWSGQLRHERVERHAECGVENGQVPPSGLL